MYNNHNKSNNFKGEMRNEEKNTINRIDRSGDDGHDIRLILYPETERAGRGK